MKLFELSISVLWYTLWYTLCTKYESVESVLWMLQTEIFLQERFENPTLSLSVYILCIFAIFGRVQVDNRWPPDQLWLACMRGLLTVSRRGAPSLPRLLPSNISCAPLCGTRHRGLTSLAPVSALARSRSRSHGSSNVDLCTAKLKLY